jgi:hypothetical protein
MTQNDTLPLPGEFTDRGVNLWAIFADAVCYLVTVASVSTAR